MTVPKTHDYHIEGVQKVLRIIISMEAKKTSGSLPRGRVINSITCPSGLLRRPFSKAGLTNNNSRRGAEGQN